MGLLRGWFAIPLWKRVMGALLLGLIFALVWPSATPSVAFLGDLFVRAIRMLVAPIVLVTIASGITLLGDPKRIGGWAGGRSGCSPAPPQSLCRSAWRWRRSCGLVSARRSAPLRPSTFPIR
jgi:hypothetical protein